MTRLVPILLFDDGMRTVREGNIGRYPVTVIHNPTHIVEVIAEKRRRQLIKDINYRHWE